MSSRWKQDSFKTNKMMSMNGKEKSGISFPIRVVECFVSSLQIFFSLHLLIMHNGLIHPCMEYAFVGNWDGECPLTQIFGQNQVTGFLSYQLLSSFWLSTFFLNSITMWLPLLIFYRSHYAIFTFEVANCMFPPLPWSRSTRLSTKAHPDTVYIR